MMVHNVWHKIIHIVQQLQVNQCVQVTFANGIQMERVLNKCVLI